MKEPPVSKTKIAIFSVSAGAGHVRAAQALAAAAERYYPDAQVVHMDVMELVPRLFRKVYIESYMRVVEDAPALWGYLYDRADHERPDSPGNQLWRLVERLNTKKLDSALAQLDPDHVICTHFMPAQLFSRKVRKGRFTKPVWVTVTDFDVHALWLYDHISGYFAANDEVAWRIARRGIPASTVHATGIPIMPVFGEKRDRAACAAEFGLDPKKRTLLMMSGGAGVGGIETLAAELMKVEGDFQVIALAGRNAGLLAELQKVADANPGRLFPMGYTNVIERLMTASDIAVTKPGGLTTSECLAVGLPMVVVSPIPGQEERNSDYLLENGAAVKASDPDALIYRVRMLMDDPARMDALRANALRLGRSDSAKRALDVILGKDT